MSKRWLVVGGGFQGIVGAYLLALKGNKVVLLERGPHLGGPLYSEEWKGFYLDRGCNAFDNDSDEETSILMDIYKDEFEPISMVYASVTNRVKTDGISIPNLGTYGKEAARDILYELVQAATMPEPECRTLQDKLCARFGPTAGAYISDAARKIYRSETNTLEANAFDLTPFGRIKFLDDSIANLLKDSAILDGLIAASSQNDPMKFYRDRAQKYPFRLFYPREHGMRGFCEKAEQRLAQLDVSIVTGQGIESLEYGASSANAILSNGQEVAVDRVFWCAGIEAFAKLMGCGGMISKYIHRVPMVLYYFVIDKGTEGQYTYIQNFDEKDLFHRASVPGSYGLNTCPDGLTYVCSEVPTAFDRPEWENPNEFIETIWEEMQRYEVVRGDRPIDTLVLKTPVSYKMPRVGYSQAVTEMTEALDDFSCIVGVDQWTSSKGQIIRSVKSMLDAEG